MAETTTAPAPAEAWLKEAFRRLLSDVVLFSRTFRAFLLRPRRSARAWQAGQPGFMNPLGFAATGAAVYWGVAGVVMTLWPIAAADGGDGFAAQIASAVGPYLHYGLLGVAMHGALRCLGSPRRILGSIGAAFFAGGSIGTLTALVLMSSVRWFGHRRGTSALELGPGDLVPLFFMIAAIACYTLICVVMASAMQGLHSTAGWKVVTAAVFAVLVTALLFGSVLPPGDYGWHPYLRIELLNGFHLAFGFRS